MLNLCNNFMNEMSILNIIIIYHNTGQVSGTIQSEIIVCSTDPSQGAWLTGDLTIHNTESAIFVRQTN